MHITIIGGSGFIGTFLINKLHGKYTVINIDKNPSKTYNSITRIADVRNIDALRQTIDSSTNCIIVLAAEHADNVHPVSLYYDVNVQGAKNILQVAEEKNINNVLFTSSAAVYGLAKGEPNETSPLNPFNHYGKSKLQAEEVFKNWYLAESDSRSLIIIRPTVVFGPGNKGNVYNLLHQIKSGKFMMIGTGKNKKSMAFVENLVDFIDFVLIKHNKAYHLYNYVDKPDLNMNEFVEYACRALGRKKPKLRLPYLLGFLAGRCFDLASTISGKKFPISSVRVKKFCANTQFSSLQIPKIGFSAKHSLSEGLEKTINTID